MAGYGLVPVKERFGGRQMFTCPAGDGTLLGIGDPVKTGGSASAIGNGPVCMEVIRAAATDPIIGVVVGCLQHTVASSSMSLDRIHRPVSTGMYLEVYVPSERCEFFIESDEDSATFAAADVGLNCELATVGDASTTTGLSSVQLDISTRATTNTLGLQITGYDESRGPGSSSPNPRVKVRFNQRATIDTGGTGA